jgi:hypothetical protein
MVLLFLFTCDREPGTLSSMGIIGMHHGYIWYCTPDSAFRQTSADSEVGKYWYCADVGISYGVLP